MIKFGDYVVYDGLIYRVVGISEDAEPTYTLQPVRKNEKILTKTVTSSQIQGFLVSGGGDNITGVEGDSLTPIGSRTALVNALEEGYIRVKFDSNGGSSVESQVIEIGDTVNAPDAPTREGYTFGNWYYDNGTFASAVNFTTDEFEKDTVLYAKWIINTFTVTYDSNGGSTVTSQTVNYGSTATEPTPPTREGYDFDDWYVDDETFTEAYDFNTPVTANITLYANWIIKTFTVTFNSNGGSEVPAQTVNYGATATEPDDPVLAGNIFSGWFTDDETFLVAYVFATPVADDITLYAKWTVEE